MLLLIALPIIVFSLYLLWREYGEYYGKPPVAQVPDTAQVKAKVNDALSRDKAAPAAAADLSRGRAIEDASKRSTHDSEIIDRAKSTQVSTLDASLPNQPAGDWLALTAGGSARIRWQVNGCGDVAKPQDALPVCAEADIDFSDGTKFQMLMLMGTEQRKTHEVQFADPSLMWAVYAKPGSDDFTPAPLSSLTRVAQGAK